MKTENIYIIRGRPGQENARPVSLLFRGRMQRGEELTDLGLERFDVAFKLLVLHGKNLVLLLDGGELFRKGRPAHRVRRYART